MHFFDAIRAKALLTVHQATDSDYLDRRLKRWFSVTFHTPLADTEDIPIATILQHYFETDFEYLSDAKRLKEIKKLLSGVSEEDEVDREDEGYFKKLQEDISKDAKENKKTLIAPVLNTPKPQSVGKRFMSASKVVPKK